jgi:hypothetical protein
MKTMKKRKPDNAWKAEPFYERLQRCRIMLAVHGFLGDRDNHRIAERIERAYCKSKERK